MEATQTAIETAIEEVRDLITMEEARIEAEGYNKVKDAHKMRTFRDVYDLLVKAELRLASL